MEILNIEIRGLYDGICVTFDTKTKEFIWRDVAIERTTNKYRKQFEKNALKQFNN